MDRLLSATEYRLLVEHAPVMVWRAGLDAKCDYFNETWLHFTGRTLQQETGDGWTEGVHPEDFDRCVAYYLDHFRRREAFEMEYRLRRGDGEYRWIFDRGSPFTDDNGAFAGFIGSCIDVHDRRVGEQAHEQATQEQLALARDFEKWILAIVGHDIRDPLNTIHLSAQFLTRMSTVDGPVKRQAQAVARAVDRIQHIVDDLLDLSREREGAGISVEPRPTDLGLVCQRIVDDMRTRAADRQVTIDCAADGNGAWDEHRVLQAIGNLTSNAVQHGKPGTPVHLRLTGDAQRVAVEVQNEGAIPPDVLPHIFEPFRSGHHHGARGQGLGLGLFIARAIAVGHGGALEVDSGNERTTFRLVLPRHAAPRAAGPGPG
jgi:PAS domain S-box-containing protein